MLFDLKYPTRENETNNQSFNGTEIALTRQFELKEISITEIIVLVWVISFVAEEFRQV
jgi:hypothetical protein